MVHRSHFIEIIAVVAELTAPLFRQDIVLLMPSRIARMVEERLTSAAVLCADEGSNRGVAAFLLLRRWTRDNIIAFVILHKIITTIIPFGVHIKYDKR